VEHKPVRAAAIAGAIGALLLFGIQSALQASGSGGPPVGVAVAGKFLGISGPAALLIGVLLFCAAGAFWGALYALLARRISPLSGVVFGLAPTLFALAVMLPLLAKPAFAGGDLKAIAIPLILNSIWGALTGALTPVLAARSPRTA
jgi:hypothetical protein